MSCINLALIPKYRDEEATYEVKDVIDVFMCVNCIVTHLKMIYAYEINYSLNRTKLSMLLYYSYAHYTTIFGEKLFNNVIEAWEWGPVIPDFNRIVYCTTLKGVGITDHIALFKHYLTDLREERTEEKNQFIPVHYEYVLNKNKVETIREVCRTLCKAEIEELKKLLCKEGGAWFTHYKQGQQCLIDDASIIKEFTPLIDSFRRA